MSPNDLSLPALGRDLRLPFGIALAAAACLAPLFLGNYALHAIIIALIFLLPAHGLNLLSITCGGLFDSAPPGAEPKRSRVKRDKHRVLNSRVSQQTTGRLAEKRGR